LAGSSNLALDDTVSFANEFGLMPTEGSIEETYRSGFGSIGPS